MSATHPAPIQVTVQGISDCGATSKVAIVAQLVEQLIRNQAITFPTKPSILAQKRNIFLSENKNQQPTQRDWWMPEIEWVKQMCPICGEYFDRKKGSPQKCCRNINCQYEYLKTHK